MHTCVVLSQDSSKQKCNTLLFPDIISRNNSLSITGVNVSAAKVIVIHQVALTLCNLHVTYHCTPRDAFWVYPYGDNGTA